MTENERTCEDSLLNYFFVSFFQLVRKRKVAIFRGQNKIVKAIEELNAYLQQWVGFPVSFLVSYWNISPFDLSFHWIEEIWIDWAVVICTTMLLSDASLEFAFWLHSLKGLESLDNAAGNSLADYDDVIKEDNLFDGCDETHEASSSQSLSACNSRFVTVFSGFRVVIVLCL